MENGALLEEPMYEAYMKLVFEEASRILKLEDRQAAWDHVLSVCRRTKSNTSSMLADVLAGRKTEADAIMGYLLKRAKESEESAPHLTFYIAVSRRLKTNGAKSFDRIAERAILVSES